MDIFLQFVDLLEQMLSINISVIILLVYRKLFFYRSYFFIVYYLEFGHHLAKNEFNIEVLNGIKS